jgi:CRP/FNR family transcriptional regulator
MTVQIDFLKSLPYFSGLSQDELDSIRRFIFEKKAERGELILFEGEPAQTLYFVAAGVVKVYKTSADGKEQILQLIRPGESFNDVPVTGGINLASAEALGSVVLNMIKKSDMEAILREHPPVAMNIVRILSDRVRHLISLVEDLSFRNVNGRVAKILLEYAGDKTGEKPRLTQQEMAAMIGTAREMVGRSLKALEEEGSIRLDRHRIIITNREALKKTAGVTS